MGFYPEVCELVQKENKAHCGMSGVGRCGVSKEEVNETSTGDSHGGTGDGKPPKGPGRRIKVLFPDDNRRAALTGKRFWWGHRGHPVWLPVEEQPIDRPLHVSRV